jgi:uncharacterized protein YjbI with pentapeptide repeats
MEGNSAMTTLRDGSLQRQDLRGQVFTDLILRNSNWEQCDLRQARFEHCVIEAWLLRDCQLDGARFIDCRIQGLDAIETSFNAATLEGGLWHDVTITDASMAGMRLTGVAMEQWLLLRCVLDAWVMESCRVSFLTCQACHGDDLIVNKGQLLDTVWFDARMQKARFQGTRIERQVIGGGDWTELSYRDVEGELATWHDVRLEALHIQAPAWRNLRWHRCGLLDADFRQACLRHAVAVESTFRRGRFESANLAQARFDGSVLIDCHLPGVDAYGSSWRGSQLVACDLDRARLNNTDWRFARWQHCDATDIQATGAHWHGSRRDDAAPGRRSQRDNEDISLEASASWRQRYRGETFPQDPTPMARRRHVQPSAI